MRISWLLKIVIIILFENMLQKLSVAVTPLLVTEPGEDAMLAASLRGAVGLPGVQPRDAVKDARLFMREAVTCVPVPSGYQGAALLRDGGRDRCVRVAKADVSIQPFGTRPRSLPVRGLPARGAHRLRG